MENPDEPTVGELVQHCRTALTSTSNRLRKAVVGPGPPPLGKFDPSLLDSTDLAYAWTHVGNALRTVEKIGIHLGIEEQ